MKNNLESLLTKKIVQEIFLRHNDELKLSQNFEILDVDRKWALASETYQLSFSVKDDDKIFHFRGNASTSDSRERSYKSLCALSEKNFNQGKYLIPTPFSYEKEYNLLIYKMIDGSPLMVEIPHLNLNEFLAKICLSAGWLGRMHSLNCILDLTSYKYRYNKDYLAKYYPDLARNLDQIVSEKYHKLQSKIKILIHGDFQPNNIIISNDQIWVIDYNDSSLDNPMIDVAGFLAQIKSMLDRLSKPEFFDKLKENFLNEYQKKYPLDNQMKNDLKIHYSLKLLQILSSLCAELPGRESRADEIIKKTYSYWEESLKD